MKQVGGSALYNFLLKLGDSMGCEGKLLQMFKELFSLSPAMMDGSCLFNYCHDDVVDLDENEVVNYMLLHTKRMKLYFNKRGFLKARSIVRRFGILKVGRVRFLEPGSITIIYQFNGFIRFRLHLTVVYNY
jgi:hypothetical protein